MFLDKKSWLKIWLNPGLNLTIFRGTGPWYLRYKLDGRPKSNALRLENKISDKNTSVVMQLLINLQSNSCPGLLRQKLGGVRK